MLISLHHKSHGTRCDIKAHRGLRYFAMHIQHPAGGEISISNWQTRQLPRKIEALGSVIIRCMLFLRAIIFYRAISSCMMLEIHLAAA